jgi:hypothetical protein
MCRPCASPASVPRVTRAVPSPPRSCSSRPLRRAVGDRRRPAPAQGRARPTRRARAVAGSDDDRAQHTRRFPARLPARRRRLPVTRDWSGQDLERSKNRQGAARPKTTARLRAEAVHDLGDERQDLAGCGRLERLSADERSEDRKAAFWLAGRSAPRSASRRVRDAQPRVDRACRLRRAPARAGGAPDARCEIDAELVGELFHPPSVCSNGVCESLIASHHL